MPIQKVDKVQIIKDSLLVFKEQGFHKTSMANLADACGLQKGSIYHYFKGKEELMMAVLDYLTEYYQSKVFYIASEKGMDPLKKLGFLIEKSEEIFIKDKGGCLMASIGLETVNVIPVLANKIRDFFGIWLDCFSEIFKEKYSASKARELAEQGIAQIEGAVMLMQLYQDRNYLIRAHQRIVKLYING